MRRDTRASARYNRAVGKDDEREGTPPTGTAVPRPRRLHSVEVEPGIHVKSLVEDPPAAQAQPVVDFSRLPSSPPPAPRPVNPTLDDIYALIDQRLSTKIVERFSSLPPPAPVVSMPVRAAKATGRWTRLAMSILGVLVVVAEFWADAEKYRGPLTQLFVFAAKKLDAHEAPELPPAPE